MERPDLWGLSPYLALLLAAVLPTHIWRWLGVLFAGKLDDQSEIFIWVKAVATALIAALIAKIVLFADGPLAAVPTMARVGAVVLGFGAYLVSGRRLAAGIIVGELALVAAWFSLS
ncbi:MAG: AzlD domain-containing protein [Acuticoccus sp.]